MGFSVLNLFISVFEFSSVCFSAVCVCVWFLLDLTCFLQGKKLGLLVLNLIISAFEFSTELRCVGDFLLD